MFGDFMDYVAYEDVMEDEDEDVEEENEKLDKAKRRVHDFLSKGNSCYAVCSALSEQGLSLSDYRVRVLLNEIRGL